MFFFFAGRNVFPQGKKKIVKKSSPKQVRLGGAIQMCKLVKIFK
jgi:hypothetical protein